jgi:hypothetical protein
VTIAPSAGSLAPINPNEILLIDLPESVVASIAREKLRAPYHEATSFDTLEPRIAVAVKQVKNIRVFVNLAVNRIGDGAYNVAFLLDTGSPVTTLSPKVSTKVAY